MPRLHPIKSLNLVLWFFHAMYKADKGYLFLYSTFMPMIGRALGVPQVWLDQIETIGTVVT